MSARFRTRAAASASFPFPGPEYAMRATLVPVSNADGLACAHRMSVNVAGEFTRSQPERLRLDSGANFSASP